MLENSSRVMLAGVKSGSGKTTLTCGILQLFLHHKCTVASLKCGPDYIDPMFHEKVLGVRSVNIDAFFMGEEKLKTVLVTHGMEKDITILEGVMGYYDGIGFTNKASSYEISMLTKTPVILVVDCQGMGASIRAMLYGFLHEKENQIKGVIFNRLPATLYEEAKQMAIALGVKPLGYVPVIKEFHLESRHLGLVTADEIVNIKEQLTLLASRLEETIDIRGIFSLANTASKLFASEAYYKLPKKIVHIAVAKDEAFCFIYEDNLEVLRKLGCELHFFSPLKDHTLPAEIDGLLLYGGYPELYAKRLSENTSMRKDIEKAITSGVPTIAECGGFLYLQEQLEDINGERYPMVGMIKGTGYRTKGLQRFGYITLEATKDTLLLKKGDTIRAHEFHYWDSENCGKDYIAHKAGKEQTWNCIHSSRTLHAGFPHIHFYSDCSAAMRFVSACRERMENRE